jgi:hypothetical protein
MRRTLQPEILDDLSPDDPRAIRSRRDLQRINVLMGHRGFISRQLRGILRPPAIVVDLGAGDGTLLLRVARRLGRTAAPVRAILVDRRLAVSPSTRDGFAALGWKMESVEADVFEWVTRTDPDAADVTLANLFLHHFDEHRLSILLRHTSAQTRTFIACEPRRSRTALLGAATLPLIGCSSVTVHDAKISVRAGFRDNELSRLWLRNEGWRLTERSGGPFTHVFLARHV